LKSLHSSLLLPTFLESLGLNPLSILMMDYDGTLAPFRVIREEAFPNEKAMNLLRRLQATNKCKLVIVTGRPLNDLIPMLSMLDFLPELWGSHGLEHRDENGQYLTFQLSEHLKVMLEEQWNFFKEKNLIDQVEFKPFSLAIHWRGKTREEAKRLKELALLQWVPALQEGSFELCPFSEGLEFRLKGIGKGFAVNHILANKDKSIPCAYVGDDLTDEDAFSALGLRGLKVLIRSHPYESLADVEFESIDEVCQFLQLWLERIET